MRGPPPKPVQFRQRRNRQSTRALLPTVEAAAGRTVPSLPPIGGEPVVEVERPTVGKRPSSTARGYDRQHQAWRKDVLEAHPRCVDCGDPSTEADHIVPFSRGGERFDPANGTGRCKSCHGEKTARDQKRYAVPDAPPSWHPMVEAWWHDVWTSPMAEEYLEADRHGLYRIAQLQQQFWNTTDGEVALRMAAEIRQQEVRFGLSPIDRRRLQWEVEKGDEAADKTARRQQTKQLADTAKKNPRDVLKVLGA